MVNQNEKLKMADAEIKVHVITDLTHK